MKLLLYLLQMASGKTPSILMKAFIELTLVRSPLTTEILFVGITSDFILGLDVMHSHDASVDLRRHIL
jgi:hypothetical protein